MRTDEQIASPEVRVVLALVTACRHRIPVEVGALLDDVSALDLAGAALVVCTALLEASGRGDELLEQLALDAALARLSRDRG